MALRAETDPPVAVLTTGDNLYDVDPAFALMPYDWMDANGVEFWITWGEEDVSDPARIQAIDTSFDSPPRWLALTWGAVEIVILDSTQVDSPEQQDFLEGAMAAGAAPTLVVFHHPPFTCTADDPGVPSVDGLTELLDGDVVMVLSGHYGGYQRFEDAGIQYVVSGGGGNTLDEILPCPEDQPQLASGDAIHHFLAISQEETQLRVEAVNVTGSVIDAFSVALG